MSYQNIACAISQSDEVACTLNHAQLLCSPLKGRHRMKGILFKFSSLLFLMVFSGSIFAWNSVGHMVVANIAYQHLKPNVQKKVDGLVGYLHQEYPDMQTFSQMSYWADSLRGQKIETFTHWHYIDIGFSVDGTPVKNITDSDNAVWAINNISQVVKNHDANNFERARFLAFLVHIVADIHQPLHTVARVSAAHPEGDKGGNLFSVKYQNQKMTLHHLWDIGVGEFDVAPSSVTTLAATISNQYPEINFGKKSTDLNPENWAKEGSQTAKESVYNTQEDQPVSTGYIQNGKKVSDQQVALAGYRLAHLLNQLLA